MEQLMQWRTEKRRICDLIPMDSNPRYLTEKQKQDLEHSLKKFNLVEIPVINTDNTILAGHQRLTILQLMGRGNEEIEVRVPAKKLSQKDVKEYNIRSNKNVGSWDFEILDLNFDKNELLDWGFEEWELENFKMTIPEKNIEIDEEKLKDTKNECPKCGFKW